MKVLVSILVNAVAVFATAYILPGVSVDSFITAIMVAVVLGIINFFLKPLLILLTLPITLITLGLFLFVINALLILLVATIVPGFHVGGFWWALLYSLILSIVGSILHSLID